MSVAAVPVSWTLKQHWRDYVILTKCRLVILAVFATLTGFLMGSPRSIDYARLSWTLIGAFLVGAGSNALNQWWEREADAHMERTRHRPLPDGRMTPREAAAVGIGAVSLGIGCLGWRVNSLAGWLAVATVVSYVGVYTPLKRLSSLCTLVGAVPGALPPVIGWVAARGSLSVEAWVLFGILFLWQLPHFLALAVMFRDDYERAGFRMLTSLEPGGEITARQMVLYGLALLPVSLFPTLVGLAGRMYFYSAMGLGSLFLALAVRAAWDRSPQSARQLFLASVLYLPVLLSVLALNRT